VCGHQLLPQKALCSQGDLPGGADSQQRVHHCLVAVHCCFNQFRVTVGACLANYPRWPAAPTAATYVRDASLRFAARLRQPLGAAAPSPQAAVFAVLV
jgi:hypothetical protein